MHRPARVVLGSVVVASALLATALPAVTAQAAPTAPAVTPLAGGRSPLGNGLGRLVDPARSQRRVAGGHLHTDPNALTIRDAEGRVLVDVTPQAGVDRAAFRTATAAHGLHVTAVDSGTGTIEGFVPTPEVKAIAGLPGLGTIAQALRPQVSAGSVQSQGVPFQRVDKVQAKGISGRGITVGALSDSFDTATLTDDGDQLTVHAAQDVASGDLPGPGNPQNASPVKVLEDYPGGEDEGRAMLQIVHDVAPSAKLCFATAESGEVGFANNIRALADRNGPCRADVVVDDVSYADEPFFADGILNDAVDDVAAKGVQYYSSAGNGGDNGGWSAPLRLIPAAQGVRGTNIDLSGVDPALYDSGFQDADPGSGTDVAQTVSLGEDGGTLDLQWDDPTDYDGARLGAPLFSDSGEIATPGAQQSYTFTPTAGQVGQLVQFVADGVPSGSTDLVLTVTKPDGTVLGPIDTGSSPETVSTTLDQVGAYTITVGAFKDSTGPFTIDVIPILAPSKVTTDLNVLVFDAAGKFEFAFADANTFSGRPIEIGDIVGGPSAQIVISRSGTGPTPVQRVRAVSFGDLFFTEYGDPLSPTTFGHPTAQGATGVAAVDPFRPYAPEFYTSSGGDLPILFDSSANRYPRTQVRRSPLIASTDGGNTTFFVSDSSEDADSLPNFFGTSAAAPHAAGIAALVLQKRGGPRSLSPAAMRTLLSRSTFAHDLDPFHSSGSAAGLTVSADGPPGYERDPVPGTLNDPNFFTVQYSGRVPLTSVTFYGETASPTAPGTRRPPLSDGIVFDPRPFATPDGAEETYRTVGFPFTVGGTSGGLSGSSVTATFSEPGGADAGEYRHMTVHFGSKLKEGQAVRFGVDRDLATSPYGGSNEGNGADELGGGVFAPQRITVPVGLGFTAVRADGKHIAGFVRNRLGQGYSPVDGYGLIDAQRAVLGD